MALASFSMAAQTIVDTTSQNRKAVLEEFTGIHCTWCPAGHLISNDIAAANTGNYFAINVHVGGYATPNAGEPDFRTSFGDAIVGQTSLAGYPAGTVNRHLFTGWSQNASSPGTAMSRGDWTDAVEDSIITKTSYVNVASTATLNLSTRVMTILVEGYFTGAGAPSTMALNVAINQNNIPGPQTGDTKNPAQMLPNGMYNHMDVLRHLVTGQWGATIDTTAQGTFFARTYSYTVPTAINGVPMELGNLDVIVFIAEGNQEIITGNKSVMTYVTPPGVNLVDLEATEMTTLPAFCGTTVIPIVKVKNLSTTVNADTFSVEYVYNGGAVVSQLITTPLNSGDSINITFPAVTLTAKANGIGFYVHVDSAATLIDITTGNNLTATPAFYVMPSATIGTVYGEDFESYTDFATTIDSTIIVNPTGEPAFAVSKGGVTGLTYDIGGYGNSLFSYMVNFYGIAAGNEVEMIFHKMDFSSNTAYGLKFNYAYAQYSSENDQLQVLASDDCGATWTTLWDKAGSALKTTAPVSSGNFFPESTMWASANIDLSAFDGKSEVIISFKAISDYGNNLYIDDINVYNSTSVSIETPVNANTVVMYPNPANNQFNLDIELAENANVSYSILNNLGQKVIEASLGNLNAGSQTQKINISDLAQGIYLVQININGSIITKKLTVK